MNDQVVVGSSYLAEGVSDLMTAKNKMAELKETMTGKLDQYTASWEGPAKQAYAQVLREWDQSMLDMERIANTMGSSLGTINDNYSHTERGIEGSW